VPEGRQDVGATQLENFEDISV